MGLKFKIGIAVLLLLSLMGFAQEETRVVDSLLDVLPSQQGREKVLTMIELTWEFYDVSYDDCIDWGEKAIKEAQEQGLADLEAKANYVTGLQFAYHGDLDLAKEYLYKSYYQYKALDDSENAFESLWDIATFELTLGNMDTSLKVYENALAIADDDYYYARACIYSNIGLIWKNKAKHYLAYSYLIQAKQLFELVEDEKMAIRTDFEIASLNIERGLFLEAKEVFQQTLPKLIKYEDYYYVIVACKDIGDLYSNEIVNYDSSLYYYQKAIEFAQIPMPNKEDEVTVNKELTSVMVGIANVLARQGKMDEAANEYNEALRLAEELNYQYGQMLACYGMVVLYSQMGQATKSLQYYEHYADLEKASGITLMRPLLRKHLAMDYARLLRFDDLYAVTAEFEDENASLIRENAEIYDNLQQLRDEVSDLIVDHDPQSDQIQTLQTERNHYRLAFFGLLAIMLFAVVLFAAYKIVRKKRSKV